MPSGQNVAAFAYDQTIGACVLVSATSDAADAPTAETWAWMGNAWLQVETSASPTVRGGAATAFDPVSEHLTLIAGDPSNSFAGLSETWQLIWR